MFTNSKGCSLLVWAAPPHCEAAIHKLIPLFERKYIWHNTFTLTNSEKAFWQWQPIYVWNKSHLQGLGKDVIPMAANFNCEGAGRHPTQKPVSLMKLLVDAGSKQSDLILDPFCGSGTTCVAAKLLGRNYIGIEISQAYVEIAEARLRNTEENLFKKI